MVTTWAAKVMNGLDYGLQGGKQANLVVLKQASVVEALRYHEQPVYVISHGQQVDLEAVKKITKR